MFCGVLGTFIFWVKGGILDASLGGTELDIFLDSFGAQYH